jgi:hypothetical protein
VSVPAAPEVTPQPSLAPLAASTDLVVGKQQTLAVPPPPELTRPPSPAPSAIAAPVVAPAASAPAAPVTPPKTSPDANVPAPLKNETLVAQLLEEFRQAYGRLDAETVGAIWPSANTKALRRAFDQLDNQELTFDNCSISATGQHAQASCAGKATYVPRIGNKTSHVEPRRWTFQLTKIGDHWVIDAVDAR